jgi:phenylalanyl-tRNA synthetase alpha subunit
MQSNWKHACSACYCYVRLIGLNKWVEVGNSGVFRPEMLLPMGFPPDVAVIAWGLSLERLVIC